jgi:hypothetical protein
MQRTKYFRVKLIFMETNTEALREALIIVSIMETDRNNRQLFPQITMDSVFTRAWRLVSFPAVK